MVGVLDGVSSGVNLDKKQRRTIGQWVLMRWLVVRQARVWVCGTFRSRAAQLGRRARNRQGTAWKRRASLFVGVPAVLDRCCARRRRMFSGRGGSKPAARSNKSKAGGPRMGAGFGRR